MPSQYAAELEAALDAAKTAAEYAKTEYETFEAIDDAPASISLPVDKGCQERIIERLLQQFPTDGIRAEEDTENSRKASESGRTWVIDPIDGTRGFARKTGQFSVMIALTVDGKPVLGVVAEPIQDRLTYATQGGGCWSRTGGVPGREYRVSGVVRLAGATMTQSHTKRGAPPKPVVDALNPARVVETYSAGVKLAQVARGEVDLYANDYQDFADWDVCAGHILVEEAGGTVTLFDGKPVTYGQSGISRRGLIATNTELHPEALQKLAAMIGEPKE